VVTYDHIASPSKDTSPYVTIRAVDVVSPLRHLLDDVLSFDPTPDTIGDSPASLAMPSLPASIHAAPQSSHTSLSFPSLTHPHRDAETASIACGLFAYVANLYVARRARKDGTELGEKSFVDGEAVRLGVLAPNLKGSA
jgi:hypothetical protein